MAALPGEVLFSTSYGLARSTTCRSVPTLHIGGQFTWVSLHITRETFLRLSFLVTAYLAIWTVLYIYRLLEEMSKLLRHYIVYHHVNRLWSHLNVSLAINGSCSALSSDISKKRTTPTSKMHCQGLQLFNIIFRTANVYLCGQVLEKGIFVNPEKNFVYVVMLWIAKECLTSVIIPIIP